MIVFRTRLLPIFSSKRFLITAPKGMTKKRHARANCCFASFACLNLLLFCRSRCRRRRPSVNSILF